MEGMTSTETSIHKKSCHFRSKWLFTDLQVSKIGNKPTYLFINTKYYKLSEIYIYMIYCMCLITHTGMFLTYALFLSFPLIPIYWLVEQSFHIVI